MKRKNSFVPFGIATAALAALAAGALLYTHTRPVSGDAPQPPLLQQHGTSAQPILPEALPLPEPSGSITAPKDLYIFQVATDDNGSHLKKISLPADGAGAGGSTPVEALKAMASELNSPLPTGTRINSYSVQDGLATVDFNQAFVDNFKGGDEAEALTINAVLATIGQFGPHSVQITVAGKKIDSLGGTLSLTGPVPVPQVSEQTAESGGGQP